MRFRKMIIVYALAPVLLLFAQRRPAAPRNRYSQVLDLTAGTPVKKGRKLRSGTRIISPAALLPGTWSAAQIPAERLIGPLVVMDLNSSSQQISVADIDRWEKQHGDVPMGAVVAVRRVESAHSSGPDPFPLSDDAAQFLMDARDTRGFVLEGCVKVTSDSPLAREIAQHGNYVVENLAPLSALPLTGSLVIIAPTKNTNAPASPVRVLAMVG